MATDLTARIATLKEKKDKLTARLGQLEGKAKVAERKRDTRRKIVVGAAVIAHMEHDPTFARLIASILTRNVARPADRETIADLLPASPPAPPPVAVSAAFLSASGETR